MQKNIENLESEKKIVQKYLDIQKQQKHIIFEEYNIIIMNVLRTYLTEWEQLLNEVNKITEDIEQNIENLENLEQEIEKVQKEFSEEKYAEYMKIKETIIENVLSNTEEINEFNKKVILNTKKHIYSEDILEVTEKKSKLEMEVETKKEKAKKLEVKNVKIKTDKKDNRELVISEKENKVYLPYLIVDLQKELEAEKKYETIEELIENEYILDLDKFKNSVTSRFKEAYKLIKRKEKRSVIDATELGLELMFNYSLNPAIIAACKNEDELDIYLDCLEENELEDFRIFNVRYEMAPTAVLVKSQENKKF